MSYEQIIKYLKGLNYVLIKYPYLVKKEIDDLDILLSDKDYKKAIRIWQLERTRRTHNN